MAYTPTTWNTGDDVTATKLNKIENGIANAGGGSPCAHVTTAGYGNYTTIGYFIVGKYDSANNRYHRVFASVSSSYGPQYDILVVKSGMSDEYLYPSTYSANLPNGLVLLWIEYNTTGATYTYSGDISQTLYSYYSDSGANGCRIVTGNFSLNADNN